MLTRKLRSRVRSLPYLDLDGTTYKSPSPNFFIICFPQLFVLFVFIIAPNHLMGTAVIQRTLLIVKPLSAVKVFLAYNNHRDNCSIPAGWVCPSALHCVCVLTLHGGVYGQSNTSTVRNSHSRPQQTSTHHGKKY